MTQTTTTVEQATWTLAYRAPRGRCFRPVLGLPPMTWAEATRVGSLLATAFGDVDIWTVPVEGAAGTVEEDRDNVLLADSRGRTRRVPIVWSAPSEVDARTIHPDDLAKAVAGEVSR